MRVEIYYELNYGDLGIVVKQDFYWDFAPFYNLTILDKNDDEDCMRIELANNEYQKCFIHYNVYDVKFSIDIRHRLPKTVADETIDLYLKQFKNLAWEIIRDDSEKIKELAKKEYERQEKINNLKFGPAVHIKPNL